MSSFEDNLLTKQHNLKVIKPFQTKIVVISKCGSKQYQ